MSDSVFDTKAGTIADLQEGPDGNLYFVSIFEGTFSEITAPGPFPPIAAAAATPAAGAGPLTVSNGTQTGTSSTRVVVGQNPQADFISNGAARPSVTDEVADPFYGRC